MPLLHPVLALLGLLLLAAAPAGAQDPAVPPDERSGGEAPPDDLDGPALPYEVTIPETGEGELDDAIRTVSVLRRLRESVPTSAEGLVARALQDQENLRRALRSEGYYAGVPRVTLAGETPEAPGLAARLSATAGPVPVVLAVEPGARYRIAFVRVSPALPEADITSAGEVTGLDPGDAARAAAVLSAQEALLTRMREAGYPFAGAARRSVVVDHEARTMEVTYFLQPGPRARFARPVAEGSPEVSPRLLDLAGAVLEDEWYDPRELDRVRRDILALGVFSTVRARTGEALDEDGRLPVTFLTAQRPFRALGGTLAYETRYGPTVRAYWEHRNLFGAAERLRIEGEIARAIEGRNLRDTNARLGANFRKPWFGGLNVTAVLEAAVLRERLRAYDRDAVTAGASLERRLNPRVVVSAGLAGDVGRTTELDRTTDYQLVALPLGSRYDGTDNLLDPSRGLRGNLLVAPTLSVGEGGTGFLRLRAQGSAYLDLSRDRGTILGLRAGLGSLIGAEPGQVPPHQRFYAGGGGSVRGYDFQRIGPRRRDGSPRGGLSLVEGSVELRQRVSGNWGGAVFLDAGSVGEDPAPTLDNLRFGAGVGVRYATAIGPIRADVAFPLQRERNNSGFGLYLGIGQAF